MSDDIDYSDLTGEDREKYARPFILALWEDGLSQTEIRNTLREIGFKFRDITMANFIRETVGIFKYEDRIRNLALTDYIPSSYYQESSNRLGTNYLIHFEINVYNKTTGKEDILKWNVGFNNRMSIETMIAYVTAYVGQDAYPEQYQILSVTPRGAEAAPGSFRD